MIKVLKEKAALDIRGTKQRAAKIRNDLVNLRVHLRDVGSDLDRVQRQLASNPTEGILEDLNSILDNYESPLRNALLTFEAA